MRILFHKWEYPPQGSGIGPYIAILSQAMREQGHYVVIVTSRYPGCKEVENVDNGVIYRLFDMAEIGSPELAVKILELAHYYKIDVIEGADHLGESYELLKLTDRPPVCIKMHYNDVLPLLRFAHARCPWQKVLIQMACLRQFQRLSAEKASIQLADCVTAPCRRIIDLARQYSLNLPEMVDIIPNPVRINEKWENDEAERPTILFVGRLDFGKGVDHLLRLLSNLVPRYPDMRLEVAGGDSYARGVGSIRKWLGRHSKGSLKQLVFLGHINQVTLDLAYKRAWLVVVPSRWDTFPNSVLESMARKKALVTSEVGGMPEMLENTDNLCAQPDSQRFVDGIIDFIDNKDLRHKAGLSGLIKAQRCYLPETVARRQISFFESIVDVK